MRVASIDIQGFKSFAKKTRIDLTEGITAVIGPNGSGKSCVVDAVRWVLGEQSIKQLRGKANTDIIFHGSEVLPPARRAEVTITFDNESGRFPLPSATVAVTRRLTRDGESSYQVNREDVRLLDLQQMLAQAGIGAKTFTVISQGMVDRYITASPAERKELFDDATGIKPLQLKLMEAHRKLKKTQQHALEIETTIRELEPRLKVLARQIKRYEQREKIQEAFTVSQVQWFSHAWHNVRQRLTDLTAQQAEVSRTIKQARSHRETLEKKLITGTGTHNHGLHAELTTANQELAAAQKIYNERTHARVQLEKLIQEAQLQLQRADKALQAVTTRSQPLDWVGNVTQLLERCQKLLLKIAKNPATTTTEAEAMADQIQESLQTLKNTSADTLIRSAADELTRPAAELARIEAILEERKRQLDALPPLEAPSSAQVEKLTKQLANQGAVPLSEDSLASQLSSARQNELAAERADGALEAALEQARIDLAQLENDILRERGSQALSTMQQKPPAESGHTPSEEELRQLAGKLAALGEPDPLVIKEYGEVEERYENLTAQIADIRSAATNIVDLMGTLHTQMQKQFGEKFHVIRAAFTRAFVELFGGGNAELMLIEEGIDISVTPPGKRSRHIGLLSGGERALTSLALLMAILEAQSPPFIVLDEVDAALDEANSQRFSHLLRERCHNTQCIVVTHNREAMASADVLYGVTMQQKGVSSVYSVKLADITETDMGQAHQEISI
ncbi:MAG: AAA family ATPase [Candidatus Andersenbacteria bacterium]|nr:AAA family ATPase [Candidatus Andersenbacteria bacterium]